METNPTNPYRQLAEMGLKVLVPRRPEPPQSLGESLGGRDVCPVPFTHDRLREAHHWWHEMAHFYHEPEPFRYRLGAFIIAARSVTFMLQSEKSAFENFEWYEAWREKAKDDPVLSWLNNARTDVIHRHALEPKSWMEMRCIDNPRLLDLDEEEIEHPFRFRVSPFACTHYYKSAMVAFHGEEITRTNMNGIGKSKAWRGGNCWELAPTRTTGLTKS